VSNLVLISTPCFSCQQISSISGGVHTDSSTLPSALISASRLSFLTCSSARVKPFVRSWLSFDGAVVGPEGTVGACKFSILNCSPILQVRMEKMNMASWIVQPRSPRLRKTRIGGVVECLRQKCYDHT
jgi:hypothetical protein